MTAVAVKGVRRAKRHRQAAPVHHVVAGDMRPSLVGMVAIARVPLIEDMHLPAPVDQPVRVVQQSLQRRDVKAGPPAVGCGDVGHDGPTRVGGSGHGRFLRRPVRPKAQEPAKAATMPIT